MYKTVKYGSQYKSSQTSPANTNNDLHVEKDQIRYSGSFDDPNKSSERHTSSIERSIEDSKAFIKDKKVNHQAEEIAEYKVALENKPKSFWAKICCCCYPWSKAKVENPLISS
jgi:hypothetical protein